MALTETNEATRRDSERKAVHAWLASGETEPAKDKDGKIVGAEIVDATGIFYQNLETGEAFSFHLPNVKKPGAVGVMLALFGARTLATNSASQARQARLRGDGDQSDIDAVRERFADLSDAHWQTPTTREGGPRYVADILAQAIVNARKSEGKQAESVETYLAKINGEDTGYGGRAIKVPEVAKQYALLRGRKPAGTDDL